MQTLDDFLPQLLIDDVHQAAPGDDQLVQFEQIQNRFGHDGKPVDGGTCNKLDYVNSVLNAPQLNGYPNDPTASRAPPARSSSWGTKRCGGSFCRGRFEGTFVRGVSPPNPFSTLPIFFCSFKLVCAIPSISCPSISARD